MHINSFDLRYNLVEFNFYVTHITDTTTCILELLINCSIEEFEENGLDRVIIVEDGKKSYVFVGYEVNEYYEEGEYVRVVCVK